MVNEFIAVWMLSYLVWKVPVLPRWLRYAGLGLHVLQSLYLAFVLLHTWYLLGR